MARPSIYLPKFNAAADFVVARSFLVNGRQLEVGAEFDKLSVPERRLRQLMEKRNLTQVAPRVKAKPAPVHIDPPVPIPVVSTGLSRTKVSRTMPVVGKKNVRKRR